MPQAYQFWSPERIECIVAYHPPEGDQVDRYQALRDAAKEFISAIVALTPIGADQGAAIRHAREALMTANAAIALKGA